MPFDRIFADDAEFETAQGNNELALEELYLINDGNPHVRFATGTSESQPLYTSGVNAFFSALASEHEINTNEQYMIGGVRLIRADIVTNGNPFGAGWTLAGSEGPAPTIVDGVLRFEETETDIGACRRLASETLVAGSTLVITEVISITAGMVQANIGNSLGVARTTPGLYVEIVNTPATDQFIGLIGFGDAAVQRFHVFPLG